MSRTVRTLSWLVATMSVAAITARAASPGGGTAGTAPVPEPASLAARPTVVLSRHTIEPVLSLDGAVRPRAGGGFVVVAPVAPDDAAYRLVHRPVAVRAAIRGGPAGFGCPFVALTAHAPDAPGVDLTCAVPKGVLVVAGLAATVVVVLDRPVEADALPLSAVVGSAERGQVVVFDNGALRTVGVTIGRSDSEWVEITGGLAAGTPVLERPTSADVGLP